MGTAAMSGQNPGRVVWSQAGVSVTSLLAAGLAILLVWGPALAVAGEESGSESRYYEWLRRQSAGWEAEQAEEAAAKQHWQELYRRRRRAVEQARAELEETRRGRVLAQDGAYAGVRRSEWTRRWEEAKVQLAETEVALEELSAEARRAEVPPGWFREVEDQQAEIDAPSPD